MSHIKTAVSIEESVFKDAEWIIRKTHISRSQLFETAVREWVQKEKKILLTKRINEAVKNDTRDADDTRQKEFMKKHQRGLVKGDW